MAQDSPPNPQTIASLASYNLTFAGICSNGHPARNVVVDLKALAVKTPDALVRDVIKRITCAECGAHVPMSITSAGPLERKTLPPNQLLVGQRPT